MLRRILCPIDFSEPSTRALERAVALARWFSAELELLHVVPFLPPVARPGDLDDAVHAAVASGAAAHGRVREGDPTEVIAEEARAQRVDLIVLGTHGGGGIGRLLIGSVAESVLREAGCPVLTVSPQAAAPGGGAPFGRILCAIDLSPLSTPVLRAGLDLARRCRAEAGVIHVMGPLPEREVKGRIRNTAAGHERFLDAQMKARVEDAAVAPERAVYRIIRSGDVGQEIVDAASDLHADLVVMGARPRRRLDLMLMGSTTNEVVRHATCPVLTVAPARPHRRASVRPIDRSRAAILQR